MLTTIRINGLLYIGRVSDTADTINMLIRAARGGGICLENVYEAERLASGDCRATIRKTLTLCGRFTLEITDPGVDCAEVQPVEGGEEAMVYLAVHT